MSRATRFTIQGFTSEKTKAKAVLIELCKRFVDLDVDVFAGKKDLRVEAAVIANEPLEQEEGKNALRVNMAVFDTLPSGEEFKLESTTVVAVVPIGKSVEETLAELQVIDGILVGSKPSS